MAAIALPKLKLPALKLPAVDLRAFAKNPLVGLGLAGAGFVATVAALISLLGPLGGQDPARKALAPVFKAAPVGWRAALKPAHGKAHVYADVIRLSERPLSPQAVRAANSPPVAQPFAGGALAVAPIVGFYAQGPGGPLPIIAQDGRTPAHIYARPFQSNGRPKVALVIGGLGLNARATRQAIETLRPEITLSFVVYADGLQGWIDLARNYGHEVLIEAPMEPENYPDNDTGPYTLMTDAQPGEITKKLEWILSRATGYFGLTNYQGGRFLTSAPAYAALASSMKARGLAFVDDGSAAGKGGGLPRASAERVIDDKLSGPAIDQQLAALEAGALQRGQALGSGFAYPVTLQKVVAWANAVEEKGYQLAPVSALTIKR